MQVGRTGQRRRGVQLGATTVARTRVEGSGQIVNRQQHSTHLPAGRRARNGVREAQADGWEGQPHAGDGPQGGAGLSWPGGKRPAGARRQKALGTVHPSIQATSPSEGGPQAWVAPVGRSELISTQSQQESPLVLTTFSSFAPFSACRDCGRQCKDDLGNDLDHHPQVRHPGHLCGR